MSEWRKVKLGELCKNVTSGGTPTSTVASYYNPPTIPWVKTKEINYCRIYESENYISEEGLCNSSAKIIPANSVIVAMYGQGDTAGRVAINKVPITTNQACCNLTLDESLADYEFVYYNLCTLYSKLVSLKKGAAQPNLNAKIIKGLEIDIPDLQTQHRIATTLSRYDSLIDNYLRQIKLLEEAAQRLYKEWFVNLRFPGHESTKIVDGVPEGWEKKKISDVCDTIGGGTPSTKVASYYEGGTIKWVTPTDITRNKSLCLLDTDKKITEEGLKHSSAKMLPAGTILMTSRASVGYFGIADFEVCTNQGFISCIPSSKYYQMYLLRNLMNRIEEIRIKAGGSTYLEISKSVFRNLDIICPSDKILQKFQARANAYYMQEKNLSIQLRLLTESRDRLLPKLLSGEIEV